MSFEHKVHVLDYVISACEVTNTLSCPIFRLGKLKGYKVT